MLRLCGSKYQQLMATADGQMSFNAAIHNLMKLIDSNATKGNLFFNFGIAMKTVFIYRNRDGRHQYDDRISWIDAIARRINVKVHETTSFKIVLKLIFHSFLRIFVDAIVIWQSKTDIGNAVIGATINAIGTCKILSMNMLVFLEATTFNYFRHLGKFLCISETPIHLLNFFSCL